MPKTNTFTDANMKDLEQIALENHEVRKALHDYKTYKCKSSHTKDEKKVALAAKDVLAAALQGRDKKYNKKVSILA